MLAAVESGVPTFDDLQQKRTWEAKHWRWQEMIEHKRWVIAAADEIRKVVLL